MKSDGLSTAKKPGDAHTSKAKNVKKPGDKSVATKARTISASASVVNGTGTVGAKQDLAQSSHGAKEQEKKPNPGARPKTSPPTCTSASQAAVMKAQKNSSVKADPSVGNAQVQPSASSTASSVSPENGASSPHLDTHSHSGSNALIDFFTFASLHHYDWHQLSNCAALQEQSKFSTLFVSVRSKLVPDHKLL